MGGMAVSADSGVTVAASLRSSMDAVLSQLELRGMAALAKWVEFQADIAPIRCAERRVWVIANGGMALYACVAFFTMDRMAVYIR